MFNHRSLPIGYVITVGNQTRLALEDLIEALSEDPRVSAFGLYVEGIKDAERFAAAALKARRAGKPIALVKSGRTDIAARTAATHTGALAGADSVFEAFCREAGIARCDTLATLIETLKVFHCGGPLNGSRLMVMGASGGDMAMTADVSREMTLRFTDIPAATRADLTAVLGPRVTIANPFDFHTYIWFDQPRLQQLFTGVFAAGFDAIAFMLDCPPADQTDTSAYDMPIREFIAAARTSTTRGAMLSSLPETLYARVRAECLAAGVVPLQGQREGLEALDLAATVGATWRASGFPTLQRPASTIAKTRTLDEHAGKAALAAFGVPVPRSAGIAPSAAASAAATIGFPVVMKAVSDTLAHKSEVGGVILNIRSTEEAIDAAGRLSALSDELLVEQMVTDGVAEILVGVIVDPQFGQILVLGHGGVMTEYLKDTTNVLPPFTDQNIRHGLDRLKVSRLLDGFRGKPAGDRDALVAAILAVTRFATENLHGLSELDVNPIIVRPNGLGVVAVDALIRMARSDAL
jgi:acetyl-CoA synthetase